MTRFGLLSLEINNEKVDEIRVFSEEEVTRSVKNLKEIHHINLVIDYWCFTLTFQSKMNKQISYRPKIK